MVHERTRRKCQDDGSTEDASELQQNESLCEERSRSCNMQLVQRVDVVHLLSSHSFAL